MTNDQINITIAEIMGWKNIMEEVLVGVLYLRGDCPDGLGIPAGVRATIPYCTEDLNAMHEAEKMLDKQIADVRSLWLDYLAVCCEWPKTKNAAELRFETAYLTARSTARQRAEAFLRTFGRWQEDPNDTTTIIGGKKYQ